MGRAILLFHLVFCRLIAALRVSRLLDKAELYRAVSLWFPRVHGRRTIETWVTKASAHQAGKRRRALHAEMQVPSCPGAHCCRHFHCRLPLNFGCLFTAFQHSFALKQNAVRSTSGSASGCSRRTPSAKTAADSPSSRRARPLPPRLTPLQSPPRGDRGSESHQTKWLASLLLALDSLLI